MRTPVTKSAGHHGPLGRLAILLCSLMLLGATKVRAEGESAPGYPEANSSEDGAFSDLIQKSPFLRPLDLSRTLVLTGVADIEGEPWAILYDRETKESHFIASNEKNEQGWQLMSVEGNSEDLATVLARIEVTGGETIEIRYDAKQYTSDPGIGPSIPRDKLKSVMHEARNYRRGLSADGYPRLPPPDLMQKLSKMSESQRGKIIYEMRGYRDKGVSGEARQKIFRRLVEKASR